MEIRGEKQGRVLVIRINGRLDSATASRFEKESSKWIDEGENSFIIDLGEVEYISSAGFGSILVVAKRLKAIKGKICFCNPSRIVREVFTITGFASIFCLYDTLSEALKRI